MNEIQKALEEIGGNITVVAVVPVSMEMHDGLGPFINCECCGDDTVPVESTEDDNGEDGFVCDFTEVHIEIDGEDGELLFDEPVALCEYCKRDAEELVEE